MVSCLDWDCDIILCALEGSVVSWLSSTGETDYLGAFYSTVRRKDAMVDSYQTSDGHLHTDRRGRTNDTLDNALVDDR